MSSAQPRGIRILAPRLATPEKVELSNRRSLEEYTIMLTVKQPWYYCESCMISTNTYQHWSRGLKMFRVYQWDAFRCPCLLLDHRLGCVWGDFCSTCRWLFQSPCKRKNNEYRHQNCISIFQSMHYWKVPEQTQRWS